MLDIARAFGIGFRAIKRANPDIATWSLEYGQRLVLPTSFLLPDTPREGIVLNFSEYRMYYYPPVKAGEVAQVISYPLGIGSEGTVIPLLSDRISEKRKLPSWYPPESIRREYAEKGNFLPKVVEPGPDNPLGAYAMRIGRTAYLIHGTNKPYGVGMRVSHGCFRLYAEDIEELFALIKIGTPVRIVAQPYKIAQMNGTLYLEVHPPLKENWPDKEAYVSAIRSALLKQAPNFFMDWDKVNRASKEMRGIPMAVGLGNATAFSRQDFSYRAVDG